MKGLVKKASFYLAPVVLVVALTYWLSNGFTFSNNSVLPQISGSTADSIDLDSGQTVKDSILTQDSSAFNGGVKWSTTVSQNQISVAYLFPEKELKGKNVLILMGGMRAQLSWVEKWGEELYKAKLHEFNIGVIIAVKGPNDAYYVAREIQVRKMTEYFVQIYREHALNETFLIAHSSGVFPAHAMFDNLWGGGEIKANAVSTANAGFSSGTNKSGSGSGGGSDGPGAGGMGSSGSGDKGGAGSTGNSGSSGSSGNVAKDKKSKNQKTKDKKGKNNKKDRKDPKASGDKSGSNKGGKGNQNKSQLTILDKDGITKGKIIYIMLDGELGLLKGYRLTEPMVNNLKVLFSFYAMDKDTKTFSAMAHEAKLVKTKFPTTILHELPVSNTGCLPGAGWCVHETMIITKPHNPAHYNLAKDYTTFDANRRVVTVYMDIVREYLSK